MTDDLLRSVSKLRNLALNSGISDTKEQALLLAIIDTLNEFAKAINNISKAAEPFGEHPDDSEIFSRCPNCGKGIHLDLSNLSNEEPMVCLNCHEVIGVINM